MARVISIEISQELTKICVVNYKEKNPRVHQSITIETPQGVISDGILNPRESFVQLLRDTFVQNKIKEKKLVFNIASNRIASREVTLPGVKENKVGEVLRAQAEEYFPVDLSDYRIAHSILGVTGDGKEKTYKVLVMAVPQQVLEGYFDVARMLGMEIAAIDYAGNSLYHATRKSCTDGTNMVAKIDGHSTMLMVITNGVMSSFRSISYGVDDLIRAVQKGGNGSYLSAVNELQQNTYIGSNNWQGVMDLEAVEEMNSSLDALINGISRVVDFHNSKPENDNIGRILLTGIGGSFGGMSVLIQERLEIFTAPLVTVDGLTVPRDFVDTSLGNYIGCIGASVDPLDLVSVYKTRQGRSGSGESRDNSAIFFGIGAVGLAAAIGLAVAAEIPYQKALTEKNRLEKEERELAPAEQAHNDYIELETLWLDARNMYEWCVADSDNLVAVLEELEKKMPSDIITLELTSDSDNDDTSGGNGLTMLIDVSSKKEAAFVLQQLRTFDTFDMVDVKEVDEEYDLNNHIVEFEVFCRYTGLAQAELRNTRETVHIVSGETAEEAAE